MILACKCGAIFESLIIDRAKAVEEVYTRLMKHTLTTHVQDVQTLQQVTAITAKALIFVMTMEKFGRIPEGEEYLEEQVEQSKDVVMQALGYEAEEEEIEGEEEKDGTEESTKIQSTN